MICPRCHKGKFVVVRTMTNRSMVIRYRACNNPTCGYRAKTDEDADVSSSIRKYDAKED